MPATFKRLRLPGIRDPLETRNREIITNRIPYADFLVLLTLELLHNPTDARWPSRANSSCLPKEESHEHLSPFEADGGTFRCV